MRHIKGTTVTKAPGIYDVDVVAKPPGKTFEVHMAIDPKNEPKELLGKLEALGFYLSQKRDYIHTKDKGNVRDLHYQKNGSALFNGWTDDEKKSNLDQLDTLFKSIGITIEPRELKVIQT